ncbi:SH3 domain-containing protein [Flexibacterium corallicola]|uniref:SH3 domain-containing protein n=1 Tax=Flexibacterium corallicola TaxID=3037259 RepID=UPI00286F350B|nr:SH3 domain-containing protein [Pseudovibrio sp. M1P-2-3]
MRQGPGTNYPVIQTVTQGTPLDIDNCNESGSWCAVTLSGVSGFISGQYLNVNDEEGGWPRTFNAPDGSVLTLYQPQITEWDNHTLLKAKTAAEYRSAPDSEPIYGVLTFSAQTYASTSEDLVTLSNIQLTEINFSTLSKEQLSNLSLEVGSLLPVEAISMSKERLTASLTTAAQIKNVDGLGTSPPPIFYSFTPAILVQTDGDAIEAPVPGVEGILFIVNTNWDLFKFQKTGAYFLLDEDAWLTSPTLKGPWVDAGKLPQAFNQLPDTENLKEVKANIPNKGFGNSPTPKVIYVSKPSELLLFDGQPKWNPVPGTSLQWASNTNSDVFFQTTEKKYYVLTSGRWFRSSSLDGPWTFASTSLPPDFQLIPDNTPYYSVRSSVPGTSESQEARVKASIPTVARVELGSVQPDVSYAGDPQFEPIPETSMSYATNTSAQVIQVGDNYFVVQDGVWFIGPSPQGPWEVATSVPDEIYTIPSSSPVYNTTYVRTYNYSDDTDNGTAAVWFGYTMGYLWSYLAWDTYVYGSGYYYPPYWRPWRPGYYPPYFPRPITYGSGIFYNPTRGVFGNYGYAYGPYRGIAYGRVYNPNTGRYIRGGIYSGPRGTAGFIAATNPITGNRAFIAGGKGVYGAWKTGKVQLGSEWARKKRGSLNRNSGKWQRSHARNNLIKANRQGNIFAGRDGRVYRERNGKWESFNGGKWQGVDTPRLENLNRQNRITPQNLNHGKFTPKASRKPDQTKQPAVKKRTNKKATAHRAPSHLKREQHVRQRGNQRVHKHRASRHQPTHTRKSPHRSHRSSKHGGGRHGGGRHGGGRHR